MIVKGVHDDSEVKQNGRDEREGYRWRQRQERRIQAIYSINVETWEEDYLSKK